MNRNDGPATEVVQAGPRLYQEGLGRRSESRADGRRNCEGKALCGSTPGACGLDPKGAWPEQGTDQKAGLSPAVRTGARCLQSERAGLAIADRCGFAPDQQNQMTVDGALIVRRHFTP